MTNIEIDNIYLISFYHICWLCYISFISFSANLLTYHHRMIFLVDIFISWFVTNEGWKSCSLIDKKNCDDNLDCFIELNKQNSVLSYS